MNEPEQLDVWAETVPATETGRPTDSTEEFEDFYRNHFTRLVAFLMVQGAQLTLARDIAQETMIKAYRRWSEISRPAAWARTVSSRALIRHFSTVSEDPVETVPETRLLRLRPDELHLWEHRQDLLTLLDGLPPRQRQVLAWTLEGHTPSEIAEELRIDSAAVRASLLKARRATAAKITREEEA
ncbi:RNA polymerase sigma factor [Kitasatospora sp. NPDC096147]|uniref:RNA polymerase sigma factor n=1 Tax=Kitasatospora sp. NPDC096147 TaxID=3364093 RepID=UPI00381404AC